MGKPARRGARLVAPVSVLIGIVLIAAVASGATGSVSYRGCISSDSDVAGCSQIAGASAGGTGTGLDFLQSVAVSADGRSVYTASRFGGALARFDRNPSTGAVAYAGCISSDSDVAGCTQIPGASAGATDTGLESLESVAVSANGRSVYAASDGGGALARFDRERPSNVIGFGKAKRNRKRGTARLPVKVPGAGRLVLTGKGLKRVVRTPEGPRTVPMLVAAKRRAAKRLRKRGRIVVQARIIFSPVGNDPRTVVRKLKLIRRR